MTGKVDLRGIIDLKRKKGRFDLGGIGTQNIKTDEIQLSILPGVVTILSGFRIFCLQNVHIPILLRT